MKTEVARIIISIDCTGKDVITKDDVIKELKNKDVLWNREQYFPNYVYTCDKCGKKMAKRMKYVPGSQTEDNPFGKRMDFYVCEDCGYEEEGNYE